MEGTVVNPATKTTAEINAGQQGGTAREVFLAFLKLGLTSFGGPIAHLGYFRDELVVRRKWIDESGYAALVALCQFLPGPASSQVGFALGLLRAGPLGALAAWTAFTLPSALLLVAFAMTTTAFSGPVGTGLLHDLKIVAVAVVAQAVWGMAQSLAPDRQRAAIALAAMLTVIFVSSAIGQVAAIALGGVLGLMVCRSGETAGESVLLFKVLRWIGVISLIAFFTLLVLLPLGASSGLPGVSLFDAFYRSGALVFGGGHVVLPLLQAEVVDPGWISNDAFLAGYGITQAMQGPLFTFAAYLGAVMGHEPSGPTGAAIALFGSIPSGFSAAFGCASLLGRFPQASARPGGNAWSECNCCRHIGSCPL